MIQNPSETDLNFGNEQFSNRIKINVDSNARKNTVGHSTSLVTFVREFFIKNYFRRQFFQYANVYDSTWKYGIAKGLD